MVDDIRKSIADKVEKALVHTYERKTKAGQTVTVQEHRDKRQDAKQSQPSMKAPKMPESQKMGRGPRQSSSPDSSLRSPSAPPVNSAKMPSPSAGVKRVATSASPLGQDTQRKVFSSNRSQSKPVPASLGANVRNNTRSVDSKYSLNDNEAIKPTSKDIIPQSEMDMAHVLSMSPEVKDHNEVLAKLIANMPHLSTPGLSPREAKVPLQKVSSEEEMLKQARDNHDEFHDTLWKCAPDWDDDYKGAFVDRMDKAGADFIKGQVITNLKKAESLHEKIHGRGKKLEKITDALRSTIFCKDGEEIGKTRDLLHKNFKVVEEDDQYHNPKGNMGYVGYHALVQMPSGHVAEVQIHLPDVFIAKDGPGHKLYEQVRSTQAKTPEEWQQKLQLTKESIKIYANSIRSFVDTAKSLWAGAINWLGYTRRVEKSGHWHVTDKDRYWVNDATPGVKDGEHAGKRESTRKLDKNFDIAHKHMSSVID